MFYQEPIITLSFTLGGSFFFLNLNKFHGSSFRDLKYFSWSRIPAENKSKFRREKIVVACFHRPKNVKLGIFTRYWCSESIEMYKKCDARVKSQLLCL